MIPTSQIHAEPSSLAFRQLQNDSVFLVSSQPCVQSRFTPEITDPLQSHSGEPKSHQGLPMAPGGRLY